MSSANKHARRAENKALRAGRARSSREKGSRILRIRAQWVVGALGLLLSTSSAKAAPGEGIFVAGIEAQGPASSSLSAVFHNPAMLVDLNGLTLQASSRGKFRQQWITPAQIDASGQASSGYLDRSHTLNLALDGFVGASFLFENFAVAAAIYSLDARNRQNSPSALQSFVRDNPDAYCKLRPGHRCASTASASGFSEVRTELTLALAWQTLGRLRVGLGFHFPRYDLAWSRTQQSEYQPSADACDRFAQSDEQCEVVESLRVRTRLSWFGRAEQGSRLLFAVTTGLALRIHPRLTIGARYRWRPNFGGRDPRLHGTLRACALVTSESGTQELRCGSEPPTRAQVSTHEGRQFALGASYQPKQLKHLRLDAQAYWIQGCADERRGDCEHGADSTLSILGSEAGGNPTVDRPIYRGHSDRFGGELWVRSNAFSQRPDNWNRLSLTGALGLSSPSVRKAALTPVDDDAWSAFIATSTAIELIRRKASLYLVPGYAASWQWRQRVGGDTRPAYDGTAWSTYLASGGDIDTEAGKTVLDGRAHPSNAGIYQSLQHNITLSLRWGARPE